MYQGFFGLNEIPFSIAPNPDYLYMSERHKEALAHLMFGLNETGGFVLLTGEVGTGKTTVSRALLAQIPAQTQVAFVLNPGLSQWELLATICDEFKIEYDANGTSVKILTDAIKAYLLDAQANDQRCLLIIDEAQHLRAEVLEQLRLLTNLETNTRKLLQVILIGQPELQSLLKRQELRQLAQRITARYHLLPLDASQVAYYINHRMQVAGSQQAVFTKKAIRRIFDISQGIPRVINLLCDRALMGAYVKHSDKVDVSIVNQAAKEALDYEEVKKGRSNLWMRRLSLALGGIAVLVGAGLFWQAQTESAQPIPTKDEKPVVADKALADSKALNEVPFNGVSMPSAIQTLAQNWRIDAAQLTDDVCKQLGEFALQCYKWRGNNQQIKSLNIPMVLELYLSSGEVSYAVVDAVGEKGYRLQTGEKTTWVDDAWLNKHWRGQSLLFWQPPQGLDKQEINAKSKVAQVQWLENQLSALLGVTRRKVDEFDATLGNKLNQFQRQQGLSLTPYADIESLIKIQQMSLRHTPKLIQD